MYNTALWPAFIGIARAEIFIFAMKRKSCWENWVCRTSTFQRFTQRHKHTQEYRRLHTEKLSAFLLSLILLTVLRT